MVGELFEALARDALDRDRSLGAPTLEGVDQRAVGAVGDEQLVDAAAGLERLDDRVAPDDQLALRSLGRGALGGAAGAAGAAMRARQRLGGRAALAGWAA